MCIYIYILFWLKATQQDWIRGHRVDGAVEKRGGSSFPAELRRTPPIPRVPAGFPSEGPLVFFPFEPPRLRNSLVPENEGRLKLPGFVDL